MMDSIAFPALGTGNLGYLHRDVANVLFEEVEAYEKKVKIGSLNRVCCVIYEKDKQAIQVCNILSVCVRACAQKANYTNNFNYDMPVQQLFNVNYS